MTLSANKLTQLEKLIEKMLDEELTHEEGRNLNRILIDSQDARTYYRRYINIHYGLIARYGKEMRPEATLSQQKIEIEEQADPNASDFQPAEDSDGPSPINEVKRRAAMAVAPKKSKKEEPAKVKAKVIDELDVLAEAAGDPSTTPTQNRPRQNSAPYQEPQPTTPDYHPREKAGTRWEFIIFAFAIFALSGVILFIFTNQGDSSQQAQITPSIAASRVDETPIATRPILKPKIRLIQPSGQVYIIRHGQRMLVNGEMALNDNDELLTSGDSSSLVEIPHTSTVLSVQANTHFQFENSIGKIRVLYGNIHFMDEPSQNTRMQIVTRKAIIEPIGTQFEVTATESMTQVKVTKGSVKMMRIEDRKIIVINKDQYATLALDTAFEALPIQSLATSINTTSPIVIRPTTPTKKSPTTIVVPSPKSNISDLAYTNTSQAPVPVKVLPPKSSNNRKKAKKAPSSKTQEPQLPEAVIITSNEEKNEIEVLKAPEASKAILWHPLNKIRDEHYWDDMSEQEPKLNLVVVDSTAVNQLPDHLNLLIESSIKSSNYTGQISEKVKASQAFSLSIWVNPANEILSKVRMPKTKPNYIISIAEDMKNRNFTLTQIGPVYGLRFRCSTTNNNGMTDMRDEWLLETAPVAKKDKWQHLAFTYGADTTLRIYVDGTKAAERKLGGDLNNWSDRQLLIIGNEADERKNRGWVGKLADLQLYDRKLSDEDIVAIHKTTKPESE